MDEKVKEKLKNWYIKNWCQLPVSEPNPIVKADVENDGDDFAFELEQFFLSNGIALIPIAELEGLGKEYQKEEIELYVERNNEKRDTGKSQIRWQLLDTRSIAIADCEDKLSALIEKYKPKEKTDD